MAYYSPNKVVPTDSVRMFAQKTNELMDAMVTYQAVVGETYDHDMGLFNEKFNELHNNVLADVNEIKMMNTMGGMM